jgi:hypothetical protein
MPNNIWLCGVPGSKWSAMDKHIRENVNNVDLSDQTPDRVFHHKSHAALGIGGTAGHIGSYFGPGMGCGDDWIDLPKFTPDKIQADIDKVYSGSGYRIIKNHFLARRFNMDYVWHNFSGDYLYLVYRDSQVSFAWWAEVMDFAEGHYPDYRPGYKDYDTMRTSIFEENLKILDFAARHNLRWELYDGSFLSRHFDMNESFNQPIQRGDQPKHDRDIYVTLVKIP